MGCTSHGHPPLPVPPVLIDGLGLSVVPYFCAADSVTYCVWPRVRAFEARQGMAGSKNNKGSTENRVAPAQASLGNDPHASLVVESALAKCRRSMQTLR
jgi:hypothetical protein